MEESIFKLTGREKDVLDILWRAGKPLTASEVTKNSADYNNPITINTVQAVLKKLLKKELIKIDQIVYSGTVLTRSYVPTYAEREYEISRISEEVKSLERFGITPQDFFSTYFK